MQINPKRLRNWSRKADSRIPLTYKTKVCVRFYWLSLMIFLCNVRFILRRLSNELLLVVAGVCSDIRIVFWEDNSDMSYGIRGAALSVHAGTARKDTHMCQAGAHLLRAPLKLSYVSCLVLKERKENYIKSFEVFFF